MHYVEVYVVELRFTLLVKLFVLPVDHQLAGIAVGVIDWTFRGGKHALSTKRVSTSYINHRIRVQL